MRNPRVYQNHPLTLGATIELDADAFGHIIRVLRLNNGDKIILFNSALFNGKWGEFSAELTNVSKKNAQAKIISFTEKNNESPLNIHLGQGISRGDRMDFTLQKSVELGVNTITPLFTERCGVKLSGERLNKKQEQWQKIVISACEQSGRCSVPMVKQPEVLSAWLAQKTSALKLNLHPKAQHSIMSIPDINDRVRLLVGPEGGLTDEEINAAEQHKFQAVLLGPRVLRTETAALTAITALQCRYGDIK
ncbi:16S rRNA (uracil(1498)-N(3))-methyltransferase [Thalassotalea profundi]|uniref:Ribosomal RNA small subunit methyltransferase E n=1 Tax=Thalassotalea profundi TaxID=2036687 RepID=A0ABQ3IAM5_9GAMM|nr:16S rRNA (uracil(1498)-N(3))-methyltransferase [Thalassotalea profundi]GHE77085.1 ribosomal RNA small subunit methyltransferase E [Thalassotalea profundi]